MSEDKRKILKQFSLVVYPVDFVVAIGDVEKEINKLYTPWEEGYDYLSIHEGVNGSTYRVIDKKTGNYCVLIWVPKIENFTSSVVAHEAGHAALEIFKYIGATINPDEDQECFCYLLGNLVRLAVGCLYEIPGIKPPVIKKTKKSS